MEEVKTNLENVRLITGNSHKTLATDIAAKLGIKLSECTVTSFSNTETRIKPSVDAESTFRGKDIFILFTGSYGEGRSVNDHLMEAMLLADACRRGSSKSITMIIPCYPYNKKTFFVFS